MQIEFEKISDEKKEEYVSILPKERREQLLLMHSEKKRMQSLAGEWLARTMLAQMTGQKGDRIIIVRDGQKKPYPADLTLHFNISHSAEYVMAAVSERLVGVDIEAVGRDILRMMKRICSGEDLAYIEADTTEKSERMMEIWTRKEALVKCLGTGITDKRISSIVGTGERELWIDGVCYRLRSPEAPEGYCCAVCEKIT